MFAQTLKEGAVGSSRQFLQRSSILYALRILPGAVLLICLVKPLLLGTKIVGIDKRI